MPTTIKLKNSVTTTSVPSSLVQGEVAINITDKKVWVGNAATTPIQIAGAGTTGNAAGSNTQVQYNSSGSFAGDADFTFNGTTVTMANDASISGLTVGKGLGSVATNTAVGYQSLNTNTSGQANTAVGYGAGLSGTTASYNSLFGRQSGLTLTTGNENSAFGDQSLYSTTTGTNNVALGRQALYYNTTASNNTAVGYQALYTQTTPSAANSGFGYQAGYSITTGIQNTSIGTESGRSVTTGSQNTFLGHGSGYYMTTGSKNTIVGKYDGNQGGLDIRTASNYIVLSDGDGNPRGFINSAGTAKFSSTGNWRNTSAALYEMNINNSNEIILELTNEASTGPYGQRTRFSAASPNNATQYFYQAVDSSTTCFTIYSNGTTAGRSDARLKKNIVNASPKLEDICKLQVRNYEWKESDGGSKEIGLIAQEVEEVFPKLVITHDIETQGDDYKEVKYSVFVPMLIKAMQELNAKVEAQALEIATLKGQ